MNRELLKIGRITDVEDGAFVSGSPGYRLSLVWPLTREVASLSSSFNVEQRLQRHITVISRRKR